MSLLGKIERKFKSIKNEIQSELSMEMDWRAASKDCRIFAVHDGDIKKSEAEWNKYFDWFCDMSIKLLGIIRKYDV